MTHFLTTSRYDCTEKRCLNPVFLPSTNIYIGNSVHTVCSFYGIPNHRSCHRMTRRIVVFVCDKATVLIDTIKQTPCIILREDVAAGAVLGLAVLPVF